MDDNNSSTKLVERYVYASIASLCRPFFIARSGTNSSINALRDIQSLRQNRHLANRNFAAAVKLTLDSLGNGFIPPDDAFLSAGSRADIDLLETKSHKDVRSVLGVSEETA